MGQGAAVAMKGGANVATVRVLNATVTTITITTAAITLNRATKNDNRGIHILVNRGTVSVLRGADHNPKQQGVSA
jgi:hypothetical protein